MAFLKSSRIWRSLPLRASSANRFDFAWRTMARSPKMTRVSISLISSPFSGQGRHLHKRAIQTHGEVGRRQFLL